VEGKIFKFMLKVVWSSVFMEVIVCAGGGGIGYLFWIFF